MKAKFNSIAEFYPYYLNEHKDAVCRMLHLAGTFLVVVFLGLGIYSLNWIWFVAIPIAGYGFAWIGHFFFEKNKPAAFGNPFYSLACDFIMSWELVTGKIPFNGGDINS